MDERETMGQGGGSERGATEKAKDKAREVTDEAREKVSHAASEARDRGEDLVDEGREKARELGDQAREKARTQADEQRTRVADGMRSVADALHRGARDLPEERQQYGRFLDGVADRVEGVSRYLDDHDVQDLTREARRFARDHTPVFLSGAFTLGMLGARFLKSSADEAPGEEYTGTMRGQRYGGYSRGDRFGRYQPEDRYEGAELQRRTERTTTGRTGAPGRTGTEHPGRMQTPGTAGAERTEGMASPRPTGTDRSEGIPEGGHA